MLAIGEYGLPKGGALRIESRARETFQSWVQAAGADEAGGILLGCVLETGDVAVEIASAPAALDRRGPTFFHGDVASAQRLVNEAWSRSGGRQVYLGEWHTHPEDIPAPSSADQRMIKDMVTKSRLATDFLFLIVVGRTTIWIGVRTRQALVHLSPHSGFQYAKPFASPKAQRETKRIEE